MTLLFFDGFQDSTTMVKPEWVPTPNFNAVATGRDGSTNGATSINANGAILALPTSAATCIVGFGWQVTSAVNLGGTTFRPICFNSASGTIQLVLTVNSDGYIEARRSTATGTLIATSSGHDRITTGVWYHLQAKVVLHTSSGSVEVKLNSATVLSATGVATSGVNSSVTHLASYGNSGQVVFMDDLWVCDAVDASASQGRAYNDYLGDLKVTTLIPSANGDNTAWSKSTGTNGAALVDEIPPNTTDYIFSSTSGQREMMTLPDLSATTGNVMGVRVGLYAAKSDAGSGAGSAVKPSIKENSVFTAGASKALSTTYNGVFGDYIWVKPSASNTPFSAADINGMQAGVETT